MVKIRPGVRPGRSCETKSITRTGQDNKKSQKRNISHIWGKAHRKDIAMKFGTGVDIHEGTVWSLKFRGCKFYRGLKFGLLRWLCLWALTQCSAYCATCDTVAEVSQDSARSSALYMGRDGRVVSVTGLGSRGRGFESHCRKKWWTVMEFVTIYHV